MWDLPRPGLELVSPALAGRFLTTAPPGKPLKLGNFYLSFKHENPVVPFLCPHGIPNTLLLWQLSRWIIVNYRSIFSILLKEKDKPLIICISWIQGWTQLDKKKKWMKRSFHSGLHFYRWWTENSFWGQLTVYTEQRSRRSNSIWPSLIWTCWPFRATYDITL